MATLSCTLEEGPMMDAQSGIIALAGNMDEAALVCAGTVDGTIWVWNQLTGEVVYELKGHTEAIFAHGLVLGAGGRVLCSASVDSTVRVWALDRAGECVHVLRGHEGAVTALALDPEARLLCSGGPKEVLLWRVLDGQCVRRLPGYSGDVSVISLSSQGTLFTGCLDGTLRLWDLAERRCTHTLQNHSGGVLSLAVSTSGSEVYASSFDSVVRCYDTRDGKCVRKFGGHVGPVLSLVLSADGEVLYTGTSGQVHIWSTFDGKRLTTLLGHSGMVKVLRLARGGTMLYSGSDDTTLRVWNVHLRQATRSNALSCDAVCLYTLRGHMDSVESIVVSRSGEAVCSASKDGLLRAWQLSLPSKWAREKHRCFPLAFRRAVRTWLLCAAHPECAASLLGQQAHSLVYHIIDLLAAHALTA